MAATRNNSLKLVAYIASAILSALLLLASWQHKITSAPLEALGFVTGAWCVWLTVKEHIWNFPIGLANSAFYLIVFLERAYSPTPLSKSSTSSLGSTVGIGGLKAERIAPSSK